MKNVEKPAFENMSDFGMEFESADFDINAAFQDAIAGVASDTELLLEEKVRRMEFIVSEGTSEIYRDFVDFRSMAAQVEMACTHDHALGESIQGSDTLTGFMGEHAEDGHEGHTYGSHEHDDDGYETDPKTGKKTKKKKRRGWLSIFIK